MTEHSLTHATFVIEWTYEASPALGQGTRPVFTEQGAFLDGYDNPVQREQGTEDLLDALGGELQVIAAT